MTGCFAPIHDVRAPIGPKRRTGSLTSTPTQKAGPRYRVLAGKPMAGDSVALFESFSQAIVPMPGISAQVPDNTIRGGNERAGGSVDWQQIRTAADQVAAGTTGSVIGGGGGNKCTTSQAYQTIAGGYANYTSGAYGTVGGGIANTAGFYGTVPGGYYCTATGFGSQAGGANSSATRQGQLSHSGGVFTGMNQWTRFHLRIKTTDGATATEMFLDGSGLRLTITSGTGMAGIINVMGFKSDGTAMAHYVRQFAIKNVGGTTSMPYAVVTLGTDNAASTVLDCTADDTNDSLLIQVTGIAAETWRWTAFVDCLELTYGT